MLAGELRQLAFELLAQTAFRSSEEHQARGAIQAE